MCVKDSPVSAAVDSPSTDAVPRVGRRMLRRSLMSVVLPAPLWPTSAKMAPRGMTRSRGARASVRPKLLESPRVSMAGGLAVISILLRVEW